MACGTIRPIDLNSRFRELILLAVVVGCQDRVGSLGYSQSGDGVAFSSIQTDASVDASGGARSLGGETGGSTVAPSASGGEMALGGGSAAIASGGGSAAIAPSGGTLTAATGGSSSEVAATGGSTAVATGGCSSTVAQHEPTSYQHFPVCSNIDYDTNPPNGGDHYPVWAAYRTYDFPVPLGFLVHDIEHGAVVIWYNCPGGCPSEVAQAQATIDALPADPACPDGPRQVIMTPYPELTVRWAASSWGWTLRSDCFDPTAFMLFYIQHAGHGRAQECTEGTLIQSDTCP